MLLLKACCRQGEAGRGRWPGHGPRPQPTLPIVETVHTLPADQRACPACGGTVVEMTGQYETADRKIGRAHV